MKHNRFILILAAIAMCTAMLAGCSHAPATESASAAARAEVVADTAESPAISESEIPATESPASTEASEPTAESITPDQTPETASTEPATELEIQVEVNGTSLTARLEDNSSAQAFYEKLAEGSITLDMSDYGNFEKVGPLGFSLPTNDEQITTKAGDIILYQGSNLVFYYDTNSWNFTKLGEFRDISAEELRELFGTESITATLSR